MIAGFASVLGKQARGAVLLEATQQTKHLTPLQADQHTGVSNTQTTRLNPQQHLKPAELLLAHRQHRHGAPPGTPEPGGVSPLSCRGVSSLYCAYKSFGLEYIVLENAGGFAAAMLLRAGKAAKVWNPL